MCQGGDPTGTGTRRSRLPLRRRAAQARPLRDRLGGDGQRRAAHQRQPVLHRLRARAASACRRCTACSARWSRVSTSSRRCSGSATDSRDRPHDDVVINSVTISDVEMTERRRSPVAPPSSPGPVAGSARRSPGRSMRPAPASRLARPYGDQLDEVAATLDQRSGRRSSPTSARVDGPRRRRRAGDRRLRRPRRRARQQRRRAPSASRARSSPPTRSSRSSTSTSAACCCSPSPCCRRCSPPARARSCRSARSAAARHAPARRLRAPARRRSTG